MEKCPDQIMELRWIRILLIIIAVPVIVLILKTLATVFIPLLFAVFISFVFAPMRTWLAKRKVPLWINIGLMVLVILVVFALVGGLVYAAVVGFIQQMPKYQAKMVESFNSLEASLSQLSAQLDIAFAKIPNFDSSQLFRSTDLSVTKLLTGTMGSFMSFGSTAFLTAIILLFMVTGAGKLEQRLKNVMNEEENRQTLDTILRIEAQIQRYFANKSLISLMTAVVGMIVLWIFGVDFVIVAGLLIFTMNFIPNIGSIIATAFPLLVCLLQYGFDFRVVAVAALLMGSEMFFSNYLEPKYMGQKLNLNPIVILVSLVFWGYVWGIVGMIFAVPIMSSLNIILKQMDERSLISAIISDK
ncbi:MAG: AI-2E family transporter [Candidatus Cloacimonetes bacterium HGW-Cloacimonetes-2]|jgi:predicted PurR-regulated permease PerM|nr:MAG: AI-2E family transporter [Candidatus Cloacimonetes bacterium HGW-Cloacimonetes-2]